MKSERLLSVERKIKSWTFCAAFFVSLAFRGRFFLRDCLTVPKHACIIFVISVLLKLFIICFAWFNGSVGGKSSCQCVITQKSSRSDFKINSLRVSAKNHNLHSNLKWGKKMVGTGIGKSIILHRKQFFWMEKLTILPRLIYSAKLLAFSIFTILTVFLLPFFSYSSFSSFSKSVIKMPFGMNSTLFMQCIFNFFCCLLYRYYFM